MAPLSCLAVSSMEIVRSLPQHPSSSVTTRTACT